MNSPYMIGKFNGIIFAVDEQYQVICENAKAKETLKNLVREGIAFAEEKRKNGYKIPAQFYLKEIFEKYKEDSILTKKIFEYENGTVIENMEDRYTPYNPPAVFLEGTLFQFPFVAYTDFNAVCYAEEPHKTGIANIVKHHLKQLHSEYESPSEPNMHSKIYSELVKMRGYKITKAYIYKVSFDPNVVY